ncbi:MAG: serine hydrolase, partial [Betaproteobacteria bacterium]
MLRRRPLLIAAAGSALLGSGAAFWPKPATAQPAGDWGGPQGYPTGWGPPGQVPRWEGYPAYRAGNYAGGFEAMFRHHRITAPAQASPLTATPTPVSYRWGVGRRTITDYLDQWPVTGLLIARQGQVWAEHYRFGRDASMRLTSWSMAKSVTSLLVGIALDQGLIRSLDDLPQDYVPELQGTLHGQVPLRHLLNMSSGADVVHERDPVRIDVPALLGWPQARTVGTDVNRVVREWRGSLEAPGVRFNYNELCPLTLGMVLRAVSGSSLAQFAQTQLWQPMGAEADASWLTDALGREYNCVGFAARLRDWARLGQLVAQQGEMQGRQIVSKAWLADCASHGPQDQQVRYGTMRADMGYKNFFWHPRPGGAWLMMNGHHGQRVLIDRASQTVLVQTALSHEGPWQRELFALFEAAIAT